MEGWWGTAVLVAACLLAPALAGSTDAKQPFVAPALNEVNAQLFQDLESLIVGGGDQKKKETETAAKQKAVQQAVQAAVQQQAYYDAYAYNMMRFQEAQAASLSRHHKGGKHKSHHHSHGHRAFPRFQAVGMPSPYMGAPLGMMPMPSFYKGAAAGKYPGARFQQVPFVPGAEGYHYPSYSPWTPLGRPQVYEEDDDDSDEEDDSDEKHKEKAKPEARPDTPGEARFREILSLGTKDAHQSPPLEYGDPLNSGLRGAPGVPSHLGGAMGAYGPPMDAPAQAGGHARVQRVVHPQQNPQANMRFTQTRRMANPTGASTNPNPGGVPMPMYAPTPPPPPAPNQVPSPSTMVGSQIFPHNFQIPSSANMVPAAQGETAQPQANVGVQPMAPNAPSTSVTSYPFNSFLEVQSSRSTRSGRVQARVAAEERLRNEQHEEVDDAAGLAIRAQSVQPADHYASWYHLPRQRGTAVRSDRVHARLDELARHPLRAQFISPLLPEHTATFPLL